MFFLEKKKKNCKNPQKQRRDAAWTWESGRFADCPRKTRQSLSLPQVWFTDIYRNIPYILYLFLFVMVLEGLPCTLLRARPCPKTPPTNCWQGLDDGSLTCTLIGWHRALSRNSAPAGWLRHVNRTLCKGPTQSNK